MVLPFKALLLSMALADAEYHSGFAVCPALRPNDPSHSFATVTRYVIDGRCALSIESYVFMKGAPAGEIQKLTGLARQVVGGSSVNVSGNALGYVFDVFEGVSIEDCTLNSGTVATQTAWYDALVCDAIKAHEAFKSGSAAYEVTFCNVIVDGDAFGRAEFLDLLMKRKAELTGQQAVNVTLSDRLSTIVESLRTPAIPLSDASAGNTGADAMVSQEILKTAIAEQSDALSVRLKSEVDDVKACVANANADLKRVIEILLGNYEKDGVAHPSSISALFSAGMGVSEGKSIVDVLTPSFEAMKSSASSSSRESTEITRTGFERMSDRIAALGSEVESLTNATNVLVDQTREALSDSLEALNSSETAANASLHDMLEGLTELVAKDATCAKRADVDGMRESLSKVAENDAELTRFVNVLREDLLLVRDGVAKHAEDAASQYTKTLMSVDQIRQIIDKADAMSAAAEELSKQYGSVARLVAAYCDSFAKHAVVDGVQAVADVATVALDTARFVKENQTSTSEALF